VRASILDLRRRMRDVLQALDRNEPVTILYRGKEKGVLRPSRARKQPPTAVCAHPAFGMWRQRDDLADAARVIRTLRQGRCHAV